MHFQGYVQKVCWYSHQQWCNICWYSPSSSPSTPSSLSSSSSSSSSSDGRYDSGTNRIAQETLLSPYVASTLPSWYKIPCTKKYLTWPLLLRNPSISPVCCTAVCALQCIKLKLSSFSRQPAMTSRTQGRWIAPSLAWRVSYCLLLSSSLTPLRGHPEVLWTAGFSSAPQLLPHPRHLPLLTWRNLEGLQSHNFVLYLRAIDIQNGKS
jgi:hypothetical protein